MRNFCFVGLLLFLVLFFNLGQDLLHNHEPDFEHHHDCPAFHIYLLFSSALVVNCIYWIILSILAILSLKCCNPNFLDFQKIYNPRAPPFQISENLDNYLLQNRILHFQNLKGNNCVFKYQKMAYTGGHCFVYYGFF